MSAENYVAQYRLLDNEHQNILKAEKSVLNRKAKVVWAMHHESKASYASIGRALRISKSRAKQLSDIGREIAEALSVGKGSRY